MAECKKIALIPARAGSKRVQSKNIRILAGHPLIAFAIQVAIQANMFDRVVVSTDSEEIRQIAIRYGADCPFLRPPELATDTSLDIDWIKHALSTLPEGRNYDIFSIIRPTSPFRTIEMLQRALAQLEDRPEVDSLRAVQLCHEHPGKMWLLDDARRMLEPLLKQDEGEIPWHARQYQDLPLVYVQNSSLEIAWARVVWKYGSREGRAIAPFLTKDYEGFSIDYEIDWIVAESLITQGAARTVNIPHLS